MLRSLLLSGLLAVVLFIYTNGQSETSYSHPKWMINTGTQFGFIVPHSAQMKHLIQGHAAGGFVQIIRQPDLQSSWQKNYNYPAQGIELWLSGTGNPEQFGFQTGILYINRLPLNRLGHPSGFQHTLNLGIGAGYATRSWDLEENHQAPVLGSKINAAITLQYDARILSVPSGSLHGGLRITHFSNGAFQIPNLGTNNASLFLSWMVGHPVRPVTEVPRQKVIPDDRFKSSVALTIGMKEIPPPQGRKFVCYSLSFLEEFLLSEKSAVGLGADLFYNTSIGELLSRRDQTDPGFGDVVQSGIVASYSMLFHKVEMKLQQGVYIVDQWKDTGLFYHRFGLRYFHGENFFLQLMLKTHFARADYGELGIGYAF